MSQNYEKNLMLYAVLKFQVNSKIQNTNESIYRILIIVSWYRYFIYDTE